MPKPFGLTIFCDDIRAEIGGKFTYVGVYGPNLQILGAAPATLPMLSCVIQMMIPYGFKFNEVKLVVKMVMEDSEAIITEITGPSDPTVISKGKMGKQVTHLTFAPFVVERDCRLMVRAYFDNVEVKLGSLEINIISPPQQSA